MFVQTIGDKEIKEFWPKGKSRFGVWDDYGLGTQLMAICETQEQANLLRELLVRADDLLAATVRRPT